MKKSGRNFSVLRWGLPVLSIVVAVNHAWPILRARAASASGPASAGGLNVSATMGKGAAGHNTIVIDESALAQANSSGAALLPFTTLAQWNYTVEAPPTCPASVKGMSGRNMETVGFMYPLETGDKIKSFCLLRSTQTCCYGPRPQYNQYLLVEMKEPVKFERLTPVLVQGKFVVDPNPGDGYIYRMEGTAVQAVDSDAPETDPATLAKQSNLPLFPFESLMSMAARGKSSPIPAEVDALEGHRVVAAGYCVGRTRSTPSRIMFEQQWWDGVAQGTPPTLYNAILVEPKDPSQAPPLWRPQQTFIGTVRVTRNPDRWSRDGVVSLVDAEMAGRKESGRSMAAQNGAIVPYPVEILLLVVLLGVGVFERRKTSPGSGAYGGPNR